MKKSSRDEVGRSSKAGEGENPGEIVPIISL